MTGVSGVYQNETCEVSADLSAVDFTRAGSYTITYKLVGHETVTETATVNIYGEPAITVASDAVKTVGWSETS
ncbi:MAG: bacterial Ig-like domain-containing protein [Clostridiales bacterium]|nr:MAG: bacterial Ig-like domain-containing protein [Clostridiales bacterium]